MAPYTIEVVVQRSYPEAQYCGRPSALGNPYPIAGSSRDAVCDQYEDWFATKVHMNDSRVMAELLRLHRLGKQTGHLKLGCHCAPKRCHVDTIRRFLLDNYDYLDELNI